MMPSSDSCQQKIDNSSKNNNNNNNNNNINKQLKTARGINHPKRRQIWPVSRHKGHKQHSPKKNKDTQQQIWQRNAKILFALWPFGENIPSNPTAVKIWNMSWNTIQNVVFSLQPSFFPRKATSKNLLNTLHSFIYISENLLQLGYILRLLLQSSNWFFDYQLFNGSCYTPRFLQSCRFD